MNLDLKHKGKPKDEKDLVRILLKARDLRTKIEINDFFHPKDPLDIKLSEIGLKNEDVKKCVARIKKALEKKEKVIIYGDYDADGITATAVLWETLYKLGLDVMPHIPERFSEGYGLNTNSVKALKKKHPNLSLLITVDNGIVAHEAVGVAKKLGIDVIVTDHHQKDKKKVATKYVIHTTEIGGAGISWFLAREVERMLGEGSMLSKKTLELAAIGTISDQIPLLGPNRSLVKYGLESLKKTSRAGLLSLFESAGVEKESVGIYDVNFIIAPRINAMGRLQHGLDSLRLLCTTDVGKADVLSKTLGQVNSDRRKIVEEVSTHAKGMVRKKDSVIIVFDESYHEGVVGLAASSLVKEFWRPSIVLSVKGDTAKASGRSIPGFNLIEAIRKFDNLIEGGGGHPMAVGFSIKTKNIEKFQKVMNDYAKKMLTEEVLNKSTKVDVEIDFDLINIKLWSFLRNFEPSGIGNPRPVFLTREVDVVESRLVGKTKSHLKLKLGKSPAMIDAIGFGLGEEFGELKKGDGVDVVYTIDENVWNGRKSLQLKVKQMVLLM